MFDKVHQNYGRVAMPNELSYQKLLIDVVKQHGGFAFKSANRFLIGVADVFFTLPLATGRGTSDHIQTHASGFVESGFLEVKFNRLPVRDTTRIHLDTTIKQQQFLNNVVKGGARAGVVSFVSGRKFFGLCIVKPEETELSVEQHIAYGQRRENVVWRALQEWLNEGR